MCNNLFLLVTPKKEKKTNIKRTNSSLNERKVSQDNYYYEAFHL